MSVKLKGTHQNINKIETKHTNTTMLQKSCLHKVFELKRVYPSRFAWTLKIPCGTLAYVVQVSRAICEGPAGGAGPILEVLKVSQLFAVCQSSFRGRSGENVRGVSSAVPGGGKPLIVNVNDPKPITKDSVTDKSSYFIHKHQTNNPLPYSPWSLGILFRYKHFRFSCVNSFCPCSLKRWQRT